MQKPRNRNVVHKTDSNLCLLYTFERIQRTKHYVNALNYCAVRINFMMDTIDILLN